MDKAEQQVVGQGVPIMLLKTRSQPGDSYEDVFSATQLHDGRKLAPQFIPVLRHKFEDNGLDTVRRLLSNHHISRDPAASYGGMIFTSQRAVEAFAHICNERQDDTTWPNLQDIPIYSVGPATTRALGAIKQTPPLQIFGEHTGNGEALAQYMLSHYGDWYKERSTKPPLLFLVGEQRRDIIPRTLMHASLPSNERIEVTEEVIYGTGVMESFSVAFTDALRESAGQLRQWVVVFSPTGCDSMLQCLGMLDDNTCKVPPGTRDGKTFIATIGPTTRNYLKETFDFEPDVCAEKPSPEGILKGILDFENSRIAL